MEKYVKAVSHSTINLQSIFYPVTDDQQNLYLLPLIQHLSNTNQHTHVNKWEVAAAK